MNGGTKYVQQIRFKIGNHIDPLIAPLQPLIFGTLQVIPDDLVEIHHFGYGNTSPGKGQQVLNDPGSPLAGFLNPQDGFSQGTAMGKVHQEQFRITDNAGQYIIEIMGHPTGKRPDGLHLLGPEKLSLQDFFLLFGLFPFRNVPPHGVGPKQLIGQENRGQGNHQIEEGSVLASAPRFILDFFSLFSPPPHGIRMFAQLRWSYQLIDIPADDLIRPVAEQAGEGLIDPDTTPMDIPHGNGLIGIVKEFFKEGLFSFEGVFCPFSLHGVDKNIARGPEQCGIFLFPFFLRCHIIDTQKTDQPPFIGHGHGDKGFDALGHQDIFFSRSLFREPFHMGDKDGFPLFHPAHPPWKIRNGHILQIAQLGRDTLSTPFMGIGHAPLFVVQHKDIAPVGL